MSAYMDLTRQVPSQPRGFLHQLWRVGSKSLILLASMSLSFTAGATVVLSFRLLNLPDVRQLQYYNPHQRTEIVTRKGAVLSQIFGEENRQIMPLKQIPLLVRQAVIAIEDGRFYEHNGIDLIGIGRAARNNFVQKDTVEGGSTITQQVTKNLFFTPEKTLSRKLAEAFVAVNIEKHYSKDQILELYLNQIYWGHNAYGIEAASETYFGKSVKQLKLHEAAMLAGLIRGPEAFSPYRNYALAKKRQGMTLDRMVENGMITKAQAEKAKKEKVRLHGIRRGYKYPYFTSYVMHVLRQKFTDYQLETGGYKVITTIDPEAQAHAEAIIKTEIPKLSNYNIQQGALVSVDPKTGHVKAMVGGIDYGKSKFNRAFQAQRQTGSAFKPFIYLTAYANGWNPEQVEIDGPITYNFGPGSPSWSPQNYGRSFSGGVTLRRALHKSINVVAVKVMDKVGIGKVIKTVKQLGISSEIRPYLSSALGASEITPLEMASGYGVFANDGRLAEATPILKIEDKFGKVIVDNYGAKGKQVYNQTAIRTLNDVMVGVVEAGTGRAAYMPGRPVAGKTGTTSSHYDAWFIGYTPQLVTLVWIGNDTPTRMYGATGGGFCAPIWHQYMSKVVEKMPVETFPKPGKEPKKSASAANATG